MIDLNLFSLSGLLILVTTPIIAFLSLKNSRARLNTIWAIFNIAVGVWGLGAFLISIAKDTESAFLYWKLAHSGIIFIPVLHFHVSSVFCELSNKKILVLLYLQSFFFLLLNIFDKLFQNNLRYVFSSFYYIEPTIWYYIFFTIWALTALAGTLNYVFVYHRFTGIKKVQMKYFILVLIFGFSGGLMNFLPVFHIDIFPYGNLLLPIYPIIFTYAILRYRLMDIRLIFKKTMAYSLAAGFLTAFFAFLVITVTNLLSSYAHVSSFTISIFAVLLIALLFNPLRNRIQKLIDKVFYKKTYDYIETVNKVSHDLVSMLDIKKIFNSVGDVIFSTLGLKSIYLLSAGPGGNYEVVYNMSYGGGKKGKQQTIDPRQQTMEHRVQTTDDRPQTTDYGLQETVASGDPPSRDQRLQTTEDSTQSIDNLPLPPFSKGWVGESLKIDSDSDLVRLLKTSNDVVIKYELPGIVEVLGQEAIDNISSAMKPFNGEVVAPVFIDDKLSLLIVLGRKLSGDIFTNEDVNLLKTVSNQTAIAIKNSSLYAEKLRSERFASMGLMSATFAHEIRNPLTSIKTFAQLFPEKYMDTDFREVFSKVVVDDVERIDGLIRDLMDFSSGKAISSMDDIAVVSLIDEILTYLEGKLEFENKKISVEKIYKDVKINILGDSEKLKQAFINIITNGCQAMGENGVLKVNITPNGREVDIAISDTGKGISQEEISRLFDPFYTTKPMGMGLGLAISKKIIEDHGGRIMVESEISKGTTFTVSLLMQTTEK